MILKYCHLLNFYRLKSLNKSSKFFRCFFAPFCSLSFAIIPSLFSQPTTYIQINAEQCTDTKDITTDITVNDIEQNEK